MSHRQNRAPAPSVLCSRDFLEEIHVCSLVLTYGGHVVEQFAPELALRKGLGIEARLDVFEPEREIEDLLILGRRRRGHGDARECHKECTASRKRPAGKYPSRDEFRASRAAAITAAGRNGL